MLLRNVVRPVVLALGGLIGLGPLTPVPAQPPAVADTPAVQRPPAPPAAESSADLARQLKRLRGHVSVLASDTLEGREAGSRGGKAAAAYIVSELKKLPVQPAGTDGGYFQEFSRDYRNILVRLPGTSPTLAGEIVIVSAHYDHVGYGNDSNSRGPIGQIHNGADDNASGVSILLQLIESLAQRRQAFPRTVLFAFWDAEESGLNGSTHWAGHAGEVAKRVKLVINLDMLGRLRNDTIKLQGWRSAPGLREAITRANERSRLAIDFENHVVSDSDHWPFFARGTPAVHLDTDLHDDYHTPADDADRLNFDGMPRIGQFAEDLLAFYATTETVPPFRPGAWLEAKNGRRVTTQPTPAPARLGLGWDDKLAKEEGVLEVTRLTPGGPAERAGLTVGDRLLKVDGRERLSSDDLRTLVLTAASPLTIVTQSVRGGEPVTRTVPLDGRPVGWGVAARSDPAVPGTVQVTDVVPFSPLARAGLEPGDYVDRLGGEPIRSIDHWRQALDESADITLRWDHRGRYRQAAVRKTFLDPPPVRPEP